MSYTDELGATFNNGAKAGTVAVIMQTGAVLAAGLVLTGLHFGAKALTGASTPSPAPAAEIPPGSTYAEF